MHILSTPSISLEPRKSVMREDVLALANFFDEQEHAVCFYFSLSSSADNSHREEVLKIKGLVRDIANRAGTKDGMTKDLDAIVAAAEGIRHAPSRLRAIFACRDQHIWQEFDLPVSGAMSFLGVGRHFHLRPLLQAVQISALYCVVMVEHGRARGIPAIYAVASESRRIAKVEGFRKSQQFRFVWFSQITTTLFFRINLSCLICVKSDRFWFIPCSSGVPKKSRLIGKVTKIADVRG